MWNGYGVSSNLASSGEPALLHMTTLTTGSVPSEADSVMLLKANASNK